MVCEHSTCRPMFLCDSCFTAREAEGATQVASPPKRRKKTGGIEPLNLSPEARLIHDNKLKVGYSRRKRAKAQADKDMPAATLAENRILKLMVEIHESILDSVRVHAALNSYSGILEVRD